MESKVEATIGRRTLTIETGKMAKQADGAVVVRYGDTVVLVTAVSQPPWQEMDFFPLTVDYREKTYAAGKFPGGFYKREGRPTTKETLTMRLNDRPIRPLFPETYTDEVQIMAAVLSADKQNDPDILTMVGASAALTLSSIPFQGPTGAARVGMVNGEFVLNPTHAQLEESDLNLVVAGTDEAITMVEAWANELTEEEMLSAIEVGHRAIREIVALQRQLAEQCHKPKQETPPSTLNEALLDDVATSVYAELKQRCQTLGKEANSKAIRELRDRVIEERCVGEDGPDPSEIKRIFEVLEGRAIRELILAETRPDGRAMNEVRTITCEVGVLPRTHGSALFTRGETQAMVVVTLGTPLDEQLVDGLGDEYSKKFMLHYNFPPFCVGEVRPVRGPGRREIGHGMLAERALQAVLPEEGEFPYTIRIVSDIMESNGSSSMASVCGGTLSLMDAGVPIRDPVAGIAMGLVKEGDQIRILSDIQGAEDHYGDMDFKVAGTQHGVTALQMDIKVTGIDRPIMAAALEQAREGRMEILRAMLGAIAEPRESISEHAPRLVQLSIPADKIGMVIGPGGKTIRALQEETETRIAIDDDGTVTISSTEPGASDKAADVIRQMTEEVEVGKTYLGKVVAIKDFGAFVEVLPGQDGLVHISELSDGYVSKVEDVCSIGQEMMVKVISIDDQNRVKLSRKAALNEETS